MGVFDDDDWKQSVWPNLQHLFGTQVSYTCQGGLAASAPGPYPSGPITMLLKSSGDTAASTRKRVQPAVWWVDEADVIALCGRPPVRDDLLTDPNGDPWNVVDVSTHRAGVHVLTCQHAQTEA